MMINLGILLLRLALALLFILAGITKILDQRAFADSIYRLAIKNERFSLALSKTLPLGEIILGLMLVIRPTLFLASIISTILLGLFTLIIIINLYRGNFAPCSCFGRSHGETITYKTAIRTGTLFMTSAILMTSPIFISRTQVISYGYVIVGLAFLFFGLLFTIHPYSTRMVKQDSSDSVLSRREALKLFGVILGTVSLLFLSPAKRTQAACCKCQKYDHFEPGCCQLPYDKRLHHYFKRCCNTCTGQYGRWRKYKPDYCDPSCCCEMGDPCSYCDIIHNCSGGGCYMWDCCVT